MSPRRPERVDRFGGRSLVAEYRKVAWSTRIEARVVALLRLRERRVLALVRTPRAALTAAVPPTDPFETDTWAQDVDDGVAPEATGVYASISQAGYELFAPADARGVLSPVDTTPHLQSMVGRMQGLGPDTAGSLGRVLDAGFAAGKPYRAIAADVGDVFDSSGYRALMIARTEISRAVEDVNAAYAAVLDGTGMQMTKRWMPAESACPICEALGDAGALYIADCWDDGCAPPDPHPNCRCSLSYDTVQNQPVGS